MKAIADTGFLGAFRIAFRNRKDYHHEWALGIAEGVTEPLLTCEAVLAETAFHLGSGALVLAMVQEGLVRSAFALSEHILRLTELAERYADRKPDLADLCLIRLSEFISAVPGDYHGCGRLPDLPPRPPGGDFLDPPVSDVTACRG